MKYQIELHQSFPPGQSSLLFEMDHPPTFQPGHWFWHRDLDPHSERAFLIERVIWNSRHESHGPLEMPQLASLKVMLCGSIRDLSDSGPQTRDL